MKVFTTLSKTVCLVINVYGVVHSHFIPNLAAIAKRKMALIRTIDLSNSNLD